jgi:hypothetical protein
VMWHGNPWRSNSSQILCFGLCSVGFRQIYDDLRTSWITLIYDENLRTSLEGIRDAQYMTFLNFVIDAVLWRIFDDLWRKSTVINHKIFCSALNFHINYPLTCLLNSKTPKSESKSYSYNKILKCIKIKF